jgi:NADH-quinone oxidoreductase subunit L
MAANADRAERLHHRFPRLHRVLSGKYYVDEAYDWLIARPLYWISDRVFLKLGDQKAFRRLVARARSARPAHCRRFARVQNGNLHLYALLVLFGIIAFPAWSWRPCLTPRC